MKTWFAASAVTIVFGLVATARTLIVGRPLLGANALYAVLMLVLLAWSFRAER